MIKRKFLDELYNRRAEYGSGLGSALQRLSEASAALKLAERGLHEAPNVEARKRFERVLEKAKLTHQSSTTSKELWEDRLLHVNRIIDAYLKTHQPESQP